MSDYLIKTEFRRWGIDPVVQVTNSNISFNLPGPGSPPPYRLKCRATVYSAYDKTTSVAIQPVQSRMFHPHTLIHSGE